MASLATTGEMDTTSEVAVVDMWAGRLTAYSSAVGMTLVLYDLLLTIKDEMRLVWPGPLNFPKSLYYINRYLTVTAMLICTYHVAMLRPDVSMTLSVRFIDHNSVCSPDLSCHVQVLFSGTPFAITSTASTILLTLRVRALYRNVRWAVWLLWLTFALFHGLRLFTILLGEAAVYRNIEYSPMNHTCEVTRASNPSSGAFMGIACTLFDLLLLVLTALKALRSPAALKSNSILFALVRDEVLFFFVISSLRVVNSLFFLLLPPWSTGILIYSEWGLESVFTARFFLNLRSIAHHQTPSVFESHPQPFEPSNLLTHTIRKHPGRPMTHNFVDLEMRKTVYSSGASPIEGEIDPGDIIHLEVLDSEAHQQRK